MTYATHRPPVAFHVRPGLMLLSASAFFMAVAAWLYWPEPERAFMSDNTPVAWLSSAQIWATGVLALRLAEEGVLSRALGIWLMLAMVSLALDEQFMLHEWWKFGCENWWQACQWRWMRELPMLAVGGLGMATACWMQQELPRGAARRWLWLAIALGLLALALDQREQPVFLAAYEEGFEVAAEAVFIGVLLGLRRSPP